MIGVNLNKRGLIQHTLAQEFVSVKGKDSNFNQPRSLCTNPKGAGPGIKGEPYDCSV